MRGTPDVGGIFPLSVEPAEGYGVDPLIRSGEVVITHTNRKFIQRFRFLEVESAKDGRTLGEMSLEEMDRYWERAKQGS